MKYDNFQCYNFRLIYLKTKFNVFMRYSLLATFFYYYHFINIFILSYPFLLLILVSIFPNFPILKNLTKDYCKRKIYGNISLSVAEAVVSPLSAGGEAPVPGQQVRLLPLQPHPVSLQITR
jgi:hypothetical protein